MSDAYELSPKGWVHEFHHMAKSGFGTSYHASTGICCEGHLKDWRRVAYATTDVRRLSFLPLPLPPPSSPGFDDQRVWSPEERGEIVRRALANLSAMVSTGNRWQSTTARFGAG